MPTKHPLLPPQRFHLLLSQLSLTQECGHPEPRMSVPPAQCISAISHLSGHQWAQTPRGVGSASGDPHLSR